MTETDAGVIASIHRYPVKGLNAHSLPGTDLQTGKCIAYDRAYAIENGGHLFDPANPHYLPENKFLMLMSHKRLAKVEAQFDDETLTLRILRNGKQVSQGRLDDRIGRQLIEQFFAAYMSDELRGAPRIVHAPDHSFSDAPEPFISLINLATVSDLERVIGKPIDPMRFRGNIYVEGLKPWVEFNWEGAELETPAGRLFRCEERIDRCAATNVDPAAGAHDMAIPRTLLAGFGHMDLGVFLKVISDGRVETGDKLALCDG